MLLQDARLACIPDTHLNILSDTTQGLHEHLDQCLDDLPSHRRSLLCCQILHVLEGSCNHVDVGMEKIEPREDGHGQLEHQPYLEENTEQRHGTHYEECDDKRKVVEQKFLLTNIYQLGVISLRGRDLIQAAEDLVVNGYRLSGLGLGLGWLIDFELDLDPERLCGDLLVLLAIVCTGLPQCLDDVTRQQLARSRVAEKRLLTVRRVAETCAHTEAVEIALCTLVCGPVFSCMTRFS
jgi:hypothetical protein